jgi:hypothetical protein
MVFATHYLQHIHFFKRQKKIKELQASTTKQNPTPKKDGRKLL